MKTKILLLTASATLLLSSCDREESEDPIPQEQIETVLNEDVAVITEFDIELQLDETDFEAGTLVYESYDPQDSEIEVGTIIIGEEGEGYIRRVVEKTVNGSQLILLTEQATMEDVFLSGEFDFELDFNDFEQIRSFQFTLPDTNLYSNGPLSIDLNNANLSLDPNWHLDFRFEDSSIDYFEFSTEGSSYAASADIVVSASQSITLLDEVDTLSHHRKRVVKWVQAGYIPVPVVVVTDLYWIAEYESTIDAEVAATTNISNTGDLTLGVRYDNSSWEGLYEFNTESAAELTDISGTVNANLKMNLRPLVTVKLYGVVGPEMSVGLMSEGNATLGVPDFNWDFKADVWMETTAGARADILGVTLASFSAQVWESEKATYRIPDRIEYVSGNNQDGAENQQLFEPLEVRIKDVLGNPVPNVPVFFEASDGNGSISPEAVLTNSEGLAEGIWTLGAGAQQNATATANYGNGDLVMDAPVNFTASTADVISLIGSWRVDSVTYASAPESYIINCPGGFVGFIITESNFSSEDYWVDGDYCAEIVDPGIYDYTYINNVFSMEVPGIDCPDWNVTLEAEYLRLSQAGDPGLCDSPSIHFTRVE